MSEMDYRQFVERVRALLGEDAPAVGGPEANAVLELARVAAHTAERKAAPVTAYLVGLALGALPADAREARIDELVERLDLPADAPAEGT